MLRRALVIATLVLAAPVVGLPGWVALNRGDLPNVEDADLEVKRRTIPADENGFTLLRKAAAESTRRHADIDGRLDAVLSRAASDSDWIDELVRENTEAFDSLERALSASRFQIPVFQAQRDDSLDVFIGVQHLVRLAAAQAQSFAAQGETRPALESALLGMRVARKLSEATGTHVLAMVFGTANQSISLMAIERLLRNDLQLSPSESRWLALQLDSYRADDEDWQRAWVTEYQWSKSTMSSEPPEVDEDVRELWRDLEEDELFSDWLIRHLPEDYLLHSNRTLDQFADMYRELARLSAMTCLEWSGSAGGSDDVPFDEPSEWETLRELLRPNYWGRTTVEMLAPTNRRFLTKRCHFDTRTSLVQALAGLDAYQHATGRLPTSLDELVPDYLPAVPEDRFNGKPLRYSAETGTAYSVGDDFTDDGPPVEASQTSAEAPAIRL